MDSDFWRDTGHFSGVQSVVDEFLGESQWPTLFFAADLVGEFLLGEIFQDAARDEGLSLKPQFRIFRCGLFRMLRRGMRFHIFHALQNGVLWDQCGNSR